jgi:hypothetical protein
MPVEATVTVEPAVDVQVSTATRCVSGKVVLIATLANGSTDAAQVEVQTSFGTRSATIPAGKTTSYAFTTRAGSIAAGEVRATVTHGAVSGTVTADYAARTCG